ncbi:MAG TPA: DUF6056 family protein [Chitinophagales bacterium]|nr:DUF6056 family protein [Chitinophagales bacterium]
MKRTARYFILLLLIAALVPYLVVCFYAFPFADDFCFGWTASEKIPFIQKILNQYLLWNGRYTADVLVNVHPLISGKIIYYQLAVFFSLLAMPVVVYGWIDAVFSAAKIQDSSPRIPIAIGTAQNDKRFFVMLASLFVTLFYLNYQPNITEGIYWYIGVVNYHLGNLLLLLQVTLMLRASSATGKAKIILHAASLLLLFISVGFNEVGALLIPAFYFAFAIFNCRLQTVDCRLGVAYCAVAIISSAFVFFSPGNFVRANEFEGRYDLLHSLVYSTAQTVRFLAQWMLNVPFVLLSAMVVANVDRFKIRMAIDYRVLLVVMLFVVFAGSFLPYFATGILGQHRTINYVFFFFILLWLLFLISVSERFSLFDKLLPLKKDKAVVMLLGISILLMAITGNGVKMLSDFKHGKFRKYEEGFYQRQAGVMQNPNAPIKKLETIPATFTVVDVRCDTTFWVDKCMKKYYLETKMELK